MAVQSDFLLAIRQIASERGIDAEEVLGAVSEAIVAAYRRDFDPDKDAEITAKINDDNGSFSIFIDGKEEKTPREFGRIASQTAKQVILQKVTEAERDSVMAQFEKKMGTLEMGVVQRFDGQNVIVEIGKLAAILPPSEQIYGEMYRPGMKIKVYLKEFTETPFGQKRIVVSRSSDLVIKALFENEIPEVANGTVVIKDIAREAGARTKVSVTSDVAGIDPIGACVGQRGMRIVAMTNELGSEKIDIIQYDEDIQKYIRNALSPAKPLEITLDEDEKTAKVIVASDQLSLAIGKDGQNVRLAAKLTGWKIDIEGDSPEGNNEDNVEVESQEEPVSDSVSSEASNSSEEE